MAGRPGDRLRPPYDWLPDRALAKLGRRIEQLVNAQGWPFNEFTPEDYIEGEPEDAQLHNFVAEAPPVIREAYMGDEDGGSATYDVIATNEGQGDAYWHVSQLSTNDLEAFSGRVENEEHGGGLLHGVDSASPCRIDISAQFVARGRTWAEIGLDHLSLTPDEIERRTRQHDTAEIRRLQELGLLPPDDELHDPLRGDGAALRWATTRTPPR
jgi:hypothetical protein